MRRFVSACECTCVFICMCVSADMVADPDFCGHWILREWPCALRVSSPNVESSRLVLVCPLKILLHIHCFRSAGMPVIWSPRGNPSAGLSYSGGGVFLMQGGSFQSRSGWVALGTSPVDRRNLFIFTLQRGHQSSLTAVL